MPKLTRRTVVVSREPAVDPLTGAPRLDAAAACQSRVHYRHHRTSLRPFVSTRAIRALVDDWLDNKWTGDSRKRLKFTRKAVRALRCAYVARADELLAHATLLCRHRGPSRTLNGEDLTLAAAMTARPGSAEQAWSLRRHAVLSTPAAEREGTTVSAPLPPLPSTEESEESVEEFVRVEQSNRIDE